MLKLYFYILTISLFVGCNNVYDSEYTFGFELGETYAENSKGVNENGLKVGSWSYYLNEEEITIFWEKKMIEGISIELIHPKIWTHKNDTNYDFMCGSYETGDFLIIKDISIIQDLKNYSNKEKVLHIIKDFVKLNDDYEIKKGELIELKRKGSSVYFSFFHALEVVRKREFVFQIYFVENRGKLIQITSRYNFAKGMQGFVIQKEILNHIKINNRKLNNFYLSDVIDVKNIVSF
jgi:hypothetical protein